MRKTLKDVAKKTGVSITVASRVLGNYGYVSQENRAKVLKVAREIGYQPNILARSLKTRKTYSIGVIISDVTTFFLYLGCKTNRGRSKSKWVSCNFV